MEEMEGVKRPRVEVEASIKGDGPYQSSPSSDIDNMFAAWSNGWTPRKVKVNEWQLYSTRLANILEMEKEDKPLSPEVVEEKNVLFAEGFPTWDRNDFRVFLRACVEKGRDALQDIVLELPDKTVEEVTRYANAFWTRGPVCFTSENWHAIIQVVGQGHRSKEEAETEAVTKEARKKLSDGKRLEFHKSLHPLLGHEYCQEEDKFLLACYLEKKSKEEIRQAVLQSPTFSFDHFFRSLTADELERRILTLVDVIRKDIEEAIKAEQKAQRDRERREQEDATLTKREQELVAKIDEMERMILQGTYTSPASAEPPSAPAVQADTNADQSMVVSPQSPSGNDLDDSRGGDVDSDPGNAGPSLEPKYHDAVLRMVLASGTCGMAQLVDKVIRALPEGVISKRQLKREILRLAVKEKRPGDRAARWYTAV